jgi:magnesium chelatase family protein
VAIAIIAASSQIPELNMDIISKSGFIGELSLDGQIKPVRGIISMAERCRDIKNKYFFIPGSNIFQAQCIKDICIVKCENLKQILKMVSDIDALKENLSGHSTKEESNCLNPDKSYDEYDVDFSEIKGQLKAKRAAEIAASGFHNLIFVGPPGAGKSMLARRIVTIMPPLSADESIEVTKIYSLNKKFGENLIKSRPFRNPHHTVSRAGLIGGGLLPKPGEISLSHRGILFLDEFSQFPRCLIEDLRQPVENRCIVISRNNSFYNYPCNFMLIIATNPCNCGYFMDNSKKCRCSIKEIENFWKNLSGPVMDRIDMRVNVARLKDEDIFSKTAGEDSLTIKTRVSDCHKIQKIRYAKTGTNYNSEAGLKLIYSWIEKSKEIKKIMPALFNTYHLSGRAFFSLIKVSRTIADMENKEDIETKHLMEAINYRVCSYNGKF